MPCKSCDAPIMWVTTESGKKMPLDRVPVPDGNVVLRGVDEPVAVYVTDKRPAIEGERRYTSHFATCPNAASHRKS